MAEKRSSIFFCSLPWRHLSVEPNGAVYSCCNAKPIDSLGSLKNSSLQEVWTGDKMQTLRKQFKNDEIPKQCETCVFQENNGQVSLREASLREFPLLEDEEQTSGEMKYFGLRFGNTCNFSCRICSEGLSTSWYADAQKMNKQIPDGRVASFSEERLAELLSIIERSGECLYFAGGEPLMQPEFSELISFLIKQDLTKIKILINTNGSILEFQNEDILSKLSLFSDVVFELSLDDFGKRAEYSRKGTKWNVIEKNIEKLKATSQNIYITPTVSIFNAYYLDDFLNYLINEALIPPAHIRLTVLRTPEHYGVNILPEKIKALIKKKLVILQKELIRDYDFNQASNLICDLSGVLNSMKDEPSDNIRNFKGITKQLDGLRNESFQEAFSELSLLLDEN